jgi:hypothetical protein
VGCFFNFFGSPKYLTRWRLKEDLSTGVAFCCNVAGPSDYWWKQALRVCPLLIREDDLCVISSGPSY